MRRMSVLILIAAIALAGSARAEDVNPLSPDKAASAFTESLEQPAPVVVWNRTIVVFRTSYNDLTPADRARLAKARIEALPARAELKTMTFNVKAAGLSGIVISIGTVSVFGLLPGDVDTASGETLETAARAAADRLKAVLDEHAAQLKWTNLVKNIGLTVVATLIFILTSWVILRIKNVAMARLERGFADWQRPLSLAGINLVPVLLFIGRSLLKLTLLVSLLATFYLWLAFCLAQFFFHRAICGTAGNVFCRAAYDVDAWNSRRGPRTLYRHRDLLVDPGPVYRDLLIFLGSGEGNHQRYMA